MEATTTNSQPFSLDFHGKSVRFVGTPDKPEWVAADVCEVLDLSNPRSSLALLDADEKGVHSMDTLGGKQSVATVYESGLYRLIMSSRKPEARPFMKWVCGEVLPSIRKYGTYPPPPDAHIPKPPPLKHWYERMRETWTPHSSHVRKHFRGMFTVASETTIQVMEMEDILYAHNMLTRSEDRPDISIGVRWAKHRGAKGWHVPTFEAPLRLNEQGIVVMVKVYPSIELLEYRRWFWLDYLPNNYITYLDNKPEFKQYESLARASAANNASLHLSGVPAQLDDDRRKKLAEHGGIYKAPHIIPVATKQPKRITKRSPRGGKR